jgi:hypothetical protein
MKKERKSGERNAKVKNEISKMWNCRFAAVTSSILHFAL